MSDRLILASSSVFRAALLKNAGVQFQIKPADIDERALEKNLGILSPYDLAIRLSEEKAKSVSQNFKDDLVIGCDQVLDFQGQILHKAKTMEEARQRLFELSGQSHYLHSGVALAKNGEIVWSSVSTATLKMRILTMDFIGRYLHKVGPQILGSVGAYQIEGEGIQLFEKIEGDHFTIIGLPLLPLLEKLRTFGVIDD